MSDLQWVRVSLETVVVATRSCHFVHRPLASADPFAEPMRGAATRETTVNLLEGAIAAAHRKAPPWQRPPLTATRYVWRLAGHHLTISNTTPLMLKVAERFDADRRPELGDHARWVARVEDHGPIAARDIAALGHDPSLVLARFKPPVAARLVELLAHQVRGPEPVSCFGWLYAMEKSAVSMTARAVAAVEAMLPVGADATSALRVHSAIGAEAGHLATAERMLASLSANERCSVARATYETALAIRTPLPGEDPPEGTLERALAQIAEHRRAAVAVEV